MTEAADGPIRKLCKKCNESDKTTFSKCRYCGTPYDYVPGQKPKNDSDMMMPIMGLGVCVVIALSAFTFINMQKEAERRSHPERLIGKTIKVPAGFLLVSGQEQWLRNFDGALAEAQKREPAKYGGKGVAGIMAASSALDDLNNNRDNKYSLLTKYLQSGQLDVVRTKDKSPLQLMVMNASGGRDRTPIVQFRVLNGDQAGGVFWANAEQLDTDE